MEGMKKTKSMLFHQYSWNSEVETTWISLICWHHKTSNPYPHRYDRFRSFFYYICMKVNNFFLRFNCSVIYCQNIGNKATFNNCIVARYIRFRDTYQVHIEIWRAYFHTLLIGWSVVNINKSANKGVAFFQGFLCN